MSVRMTPSGGGTTRAPGTRYPRSAPVPFDLTGIPAEVEPHSAGPAAADPPGTAVPGPLAASRGEIRAARRRRRRLMLVCAVVIALCVGLTIAVVGLARNREPGALPVRSRPALPAPGAAWSHAPALLSAVSYPSRESGPPVQ
jgi:hypothetical protein